MAYCGNCGTQLTEGSSACPGCGSSIPKRTGTAPYGPSMQVDWSGRPVYGQMSPPVNPGYSAEDQTSILDCNGAQQYDQTTLLDKNNAAVYSGRSTPLQKVGQVRYQPPVQNRAPIPEASQVEEEPKKKNLWKILLPVIGGTVLLLIMVLVLVLGGRSSRAAALTEQELLAVDEWALLFAMNGDSYVERDDVFLTLKEDRSGLLTIGTDVQTSFDWSYTGSDGESYIYEARDADGVNYTIYLYYSGEMEGVLSFYVDKTLIFFFE